MSYKRKTIKNDGPRSSSHMTEERKRTIVVAWKKAYVAAKVEDACDEKEEVVGACCFSVVQLITTLMDSCHGVAASMSSCLSLCSTRQPVGDNRRLITSVVRPL